MRAMRTHARAGHRGWRGRLGRLCAGAWCVLLAAAPPAMAQGQPTVFIHGLTGNSGSWASTSAWLQGQVPISPILPTLGWQNVFSTQASNLDSALGSNSDVVATAGSNGGVVLRHYLQQMGASSKIDRALTIGTPHQGAMLADNVLNGQLVYYAGLLGGTLIAPFDFYNQYDWQWFQPYANSVTSTLANLFYFAQLLPPWVSQIGFAAYAPVLTQMGPNSSFISSLNAGAGAETTATTDRVVVGSAADPENAVFTALGQNPSAWGAVRETLYWFAEYMYAHYATHPNPFLANNAGMWALLADALSYMDLDWAIMIGAGQPGYPFIYANDGIVPLASQMGWPVATQTRSFPFPQYNIPHRQQGEDYAIRSYMVDVFENTFNVTFPPNPLTVHVVGPQQTDNVHVETCLWEADVSGGQPPYQYEWTFNYTELVSTDAEVLGVFLPPEANDDFALEVRVTDNLGTQVIDGLIVSINFTYPPCAMY